MIMMKEHSLVSLALLAVVSLCSASSHQSLFEEHPHDTVVKEWGDLRLTCVATSDLPSDIIWRLNDAPLTQTFTTATSTRNQTRTSTLTVPGVRYRGNVTNSFSCILLVNSSLTSSESAAVTIEPALRLVYNGEAIKAMDSSTIAVDLGANLMIDCLGSVGDLSWTKDGSAISNSSEDERVYQQGDSRQNTLKQTLFVTNFTGEDPGNYTCSSTFEGIDTITVSLKYSPPRPDCQNISSDCKSELCMDFCGTTEMCTPKTVTDMVPSSNQCEGREICIVVAAVLGAILFLVIFFICTALLALGCYMHNRKSPKEPEIEIIENEATDDPLANSLRLKPNESTSSSFKKLEEDSSL